MAKRGTKVLQARKPDLSDDSLLVRSAESLGRVIGSLQRQVQNGSKRVSSIAGDAIEALPELPRLDGVLGEVMPRRTARKRTAPRKPAARKPAARKAKATRKTAGGRKRAAARKTSKKR